MEDIEKARKVIAAERTMRLKAENDVRRLTRDLAKLRKTIAVLYAKLHSREESTHAA